eukprot:TRINITY_DN8098_c0_g1_i1.p1 TRINITY_DN8098_c0_g1~~TRINITY_DN8098_c0_g1_i1.p1  ORF type:complete len:689 (+),score=64.31 TRINITY_DN8098_c0_g1_i1:34-2067(+)
MAGRAPSPALVCLFLILLGLGAVEGIGDFTLNFGNQGNLYTNEAGQSAIFTISLSDVPTAEVSVFVESTDPAAGFAFPSLLTFDSQTWNDSREIVVTGLNDTVNEKGFTPYGVNLESSSSDVEFSDVRAFVAVVNLNLLWPRIFSIQPTELPVDSDDTKISVVGDNFSGASVRIGGKRVSAIRLGGNLTFIAPTVTVEGYKTLEIINGDGGFVVVEDAFFFGNMECADGAVCPGGGRMWPKEGYWNHDEFSGYVAHCGNIADCRCAGGEESECHEGYTDNLCSLCEDDYFEMAEICTECEHEAVIVVIYWLFNLLIWAAFIGASWFCPTFIYNLFGFIIPALQLPRIAGQMAPYDIPEALRYIYSLLSFTTIDIEFFHFGCFIDQMTYHHNFYINWIVVLLIPILAFAPVELFRLIRTMMGHDEDKVTKMYGGRMVRICLTWCITVYWIITTNSLKSFYCIDTNWHDPVLYHERSQKCDDPDHIIVIIVSIVTILAFSVALPLLSAIAFIIFRKKLWEDEWLNYFGVWYGSVKSIFFFLWTNIMMLLFFALSVVQVFAPKVGQWVISSVLFTLMFVLVVIFLPFDHIWKNAVVAVGFAVAMVFNILSLATSSDLFNDDLTIVGSVILLFILPAVMIIALIAITIKIIYDLVKKDDSDNDGISGYFMKEIKRDTGGDS